MSHVTCHVSHVKCHMSPVTCHMSQVKKKIFIFFFFSFFYVKKIGQSGGASLVEGLLSTGPTPSFSPISPLNNKRKSTSFSYEINLLLKISFQQVLFILNKSKKINKIDLGCKKNLNLTFFPNWPCPPPSPP